MWTANVLWVAMLHQAYAPRTSAGLVEVHVHPLKLQVAVALQQQKRSGKAFAAVDILRAWLPVGNIGEHTS